MNKSEIRKYIKSKKENLSISDIYTKSKVITQKLLLSKDYNDAKIIFIYVNTNEEVITHNIIRHAWSKGKKVAVPRIEKKKMEFYFITGFDELKTGYYNIQEPTTDNIAEAKEGLMIMPGLAFDKDMNRLGYGGGYYDKYLEYRDYFCKIALAYDFQIFNQIEHNERDIKVDYIMTEKNIYF